MRVFIGGPLGTSINLSQLDCTSVTLSNAKTIPIYHRNPNFLNKYRREMNEEPSFHNPSVFCPLQPPPVALTKNICTCNRSAKACVSCLLMLI